MQVTEIHYTIVVDRTRWTVGFHKRDKGYAVTVYNGSEESVVTYPSVNLAKLTEDLAIGYVKEVMKAKKPTKKKAALPMEDVAHAS